MKYMKKKVIVGGTFDFLHAGHKALLSRALELGETKIGLVSDEMAKLVKGRKVTAFEERKKDLQDFVGENTIIFELNDKFGPTLAGDFDYIVVSPETIKTALEINAERKAAGKKAMEVVKIDYVLAQDGKPISSTRIFNGEIDREGNLIK